MVHIETETIVATAVYKFFIFQIHIDKILELSYSVTLRLSYYVLELLAQKGKHKEWLP